jgi:transketolase
MGMADIATVLFTRFLKFDPPTPLARPRPLRAVRRPRLDAALRAAPPAGYEDMTLEELKNFRQLGSAPPATRNTAMPPASRPPPARSARGSATPSAWRWPSACSNARFGDDLVDHYTYVLAGDGA